MMRVYPYPTAPTLIINELNGFESLRRDSVLSVCEPLSIERRTLGPNLTLSLQKKKEVSALWKINRNFFAPETAIRYKIHLVNGIRQFRINKLSPCFNREALSTLVYRYFSGESFSFFPRLVSSLLLLSLLATMWTVSKFKINKRSLAIIIPGENDL